MGHLTMVRKSAKSATTPALEAPLHNAEIAVRLDDMATMLELGGANPFRVRAYRNASRLLGRYGREAAEMIAKGESLDALPGIGEDLAGKIQDLALTGTTKLLQSLKSETPPVALELMRIPGLGPKRIRALIDELDVHRIEQLHRAALDGRVRLVPGFGAKLERYILSALQSRALKTTRVKLATAARAATPLLEYLRGWPGVVRAVAAGSLRRGQETVGDIDILVTAGNSAAVVGHFTKYPEAATVDAAGTTRATVHLRSGLQVDLRVVPDESFGSALQYFTGSKAHVIALRALGRERGLKINEYGVFRGRRRIAGKDEAEVFAAVGLPYIEPELRENRGEIEAARAGRLPKLVTLQDLRGDLHVHSAHTDGHGTIREMAAAATAHNLSYIAITDHSKRMTMAHGLDSTRLRRQGEEIERVNREFPGVEILKGIEVDILPDGTLDLSDKVLSQLDIVVAAVHSHFHLSRAEQTARVERALANPLVTILAHPTGRLMPDREPYDVDMPRLIRMAAANRVALEVNAQPERLDLIDAHCRMAKAAGVPISIASDAHAAEDYDNLAYGVSQARRGWLEAGNVLNTKTLAELRAYLDRRTARKG